MSASTLIRFPYSYVFFYLIFIYLFLFSDFEKLYEIDPTLKVAIEAKTRLPPLVKMQQEKEAAEAIGTCLSF